VLVQWTEPQEMKRSEDIGGKGRRGQGAYYRPELDALRFFAFLCVFAFHRMDYVPPNSVWAFRIGTIGAFGVPVFFLLSAFLITELLWRERERTGRVHVGAFYMRRILRIWPLYFVAFFGLALLNHFVPGTGSDDWRAWLAFTFFAGNWYVTFHGWIAGAVDPLWSISVEEQFYIVIPVMLAWGGRRALLYASSALLVVAYVVVLFYALHPTTGDNGEWTNSFVQFQFFCAGTLLALLLRERVVRLPMAVRVAGFAVGAGLWMLAMVRFHVQSWEPHPTPAGAVAGWLLVLAGTLCLFLSALGVPSRWVPRWLAYLGRISYGLYVFHSLVFFLVFDKGFRFLRPRLTGTRIPAAVWSDLGVAVVLALSVLAAHLSFKYFERPFLRLKERFTFIASREEVTEASRV
jgi:peptidoglycan/LPS O-acetylase OafA/YrhL